MAERRISFTVPLVPPSVNHYVKHTRKGRHYVTKEAVAFKEAVAIISRRRSIVAQQYQVFIGVYLGKGMRGDIDNYLKVALDSLVSAGVIDSDANVTALSISKSRDKENPRTEFTIEAIERGEVKANGQ